MNWANATMIMLAFLASVGLTCWGYSMCYYGRGMRVVYGFAICILALVPMFYAVGRLIDTLASP